VENTDLLDDGVVVLFVSDDSGIVREVREQPPAGWGCPTDQRGAASPVPGDGPEPGGARLPSEAAAASGDPPSVSVVAEPGVSPIP
jgi:hypothetical protein